MTQKSILSLAILILLTVACVPMKTFQDAKSSQDKMSNELATIKRDSRELGVQNNELNAQVAGLTNFNSDLVADTQRLARRVFKLKYELDRSSKLYSDLLNTYDKSTEGTSQEMRDLLQQLQDFQNDLQAGEDALSSTQAALMEKRGRLEKTVEDLEGAKNAIEERNARILEMERLINQKDSLMNSLQHRVVEAMKGYQGNGLDVHMKDGRLYVSLDEKLLFKSGQWAVDPNGQQALTKLAVVLAENKDIKVLIEGHTDNVPFNGSGQIKDNWDLSVKRATSIVAILLQNKGIAPSRITAAGRGEYIPLDPAETKEARQKNRRTEVILTPDLDELMKVVGGN